MIAHDIGVRLYGDKLPPAACGTLQALHANYAAGDIKVIFFDADSGIGLVIAKRQYGYGSHPFYIEEVEGKTTLRYRNRDRVLKGGE